MTIAAPRHLLDDRDAASRDDRKKKAGPGHTGPAVVGTIAMVIFFLVVPGLLCIDGAANDIFVRPTWYMFLLTAGGVGIMVASLCWVGIDFLFRIKRLTSSVEGLQDEVRALGAENADLRRQQVTTTTALIDCLRKGFGDLGVTIEADKIEHGNQRWYIGYAARDQELAGETPATLLPFPRRTVPVTRPGEGTAPSRDRSRGRDAPAR